MHKDKYSEVSQNYAKLALVSDLNPDDGLDWCSSFENSFSGITKQKYAIAVNSGTSGLHAALLALGIGPGDEVISPSLTVVMDAFATLYVGATPVFADVLPDTWNMDPTSVESLITSKTRAIISVSWFGLPSNLSAMRVIADKFNLHLIDDSAETILLGGYEPNEDSAPDIRVFSFESKKHMSTGGEGGMVTTRNEETATKIRKAAGIGYKHLTAKKGRTSLSARTFQNPLYERFDTLGFNYRMTPVTAAIGIGQLEVLPKLLSARIECAKKWSDAVDGCSWLIPQLIPKDTIHSYYTYGVRYEGEPSHGLTWQDFYDRYTQLGGDGFYANCMNPYLEPILKGKIIGTQTFAKGLSPVAESLQRKIMAFKTNYLEIEQISHNAEILSTLIDDLGR
jgi:perosamine synthetase